MITTEKLKIFENYKGDLDAYARSTHSDQKNDFPESEWQLIQNCKQDIGLINNGLSSNDYNYKAIEKIKNNTDLKAFEILSNQITGYADFQKIGKVLRKVRAKIDRNTNVIWSNFENIESFIQELESDIKAIESCDGKALEKVKVNFLPTGNYQEISLSNNWGDEYLKLASNFDTIYNTLAKNKIKKRSLKKMALYLSIIVLFALVPLLLMAGFGTMLYIKYEVEPKYFTIEQNSKLTDAQKKSEYEELGQRERKLTTEYYLLFAGGILSLVSATSLTIKRRKIIGGR